MGGVAAPLLKPQIFRAYDVRGIAGTDLTPGVFAIIGKAYGSYLQRRFQGRRVVVSRDNRPSSAALYDALIDGLRSTGIDVTPIGLAPSPLMYFAAFQWGMEGGVAVTASHNPVEFNGAKLLREQAMPLLPQEIQEVRVIAESGDFVTGVGTLETRDPTGEYLSLLADRFRLARPLRIVADPGNGVATLTGPAALEAIGADVVGLYTDLTEGFPNHLPDPQDPENVRDLAAEVVKQNADLGVAWDGDGDRIGVVDERGVRQEADRLVALLARDVLTRHPGAPILMDLKSSQGCILDVADHGGEPLLGRTGYSIFRRRMRNEEILFGGEVSGHIIFGEDYPYLDDGVYAACALAKIVASQALPPSSHFAGMRRFVTSPELKLPCDDEQKFRVVQALADSFRERFDVSELDGVRIQFSDGWALVRASNTYPCLSVRFEAETHDRYDAIRALLWEALRDYPEVTIPPGAGEPLPQP